MRVWKPLSSRRVLKSLRISSKRKGKKRTIFTSGGLGLLQMVLESDIGRCANEDGEARRGVDTERCASEDARPCRGGGS